MHIVRLQTLGFLELKVASLWKPLPNSSATANKHVSVFYFSPDQKLFVQQLVANCVRLLFGAGMGVCSGFIRDLP